jgi:hypothetical protein
LLDPDRMQRRISALGAARHDIIRSTVTNEQNPTHLSDCHLKCRLGNSLCGGVLHL